MKKLITLLMVNLLIIGVLAGCNSEKPPASTTGTENNSGGSTETEKEKEPEKETTSGEPIYLGLIDAFTGERAMSGAYAKEGAEMFLEHINSNGGVLGREVVVVYEDDQGNETMGTNAFQKITSEKDLSAIMLSKFSSVVLAMEPFIAEEEIPAIAMGSSVRIADMENDWLYSARKSDLGSGESMAAAADEILGMTKVAIIHAPDALGTGMAPVVQEALEARGVEIVSVQQFSADEKNFSPYVAKIIDSGCDGIVAIAQQTEAALLMIAVDESGLDVPCIGSSAFCQQTAIENSGTSCNGWYSVTAWSPTIDDEPAKSWIADYTAKYGHEPDMGSALVYDSLSLMCDAIERAGSSDPADVNKAISETKGYAGLSSTYAFTEGTRMIATSEYLTEIKDQQSIVVDVIFSD